MPFSLYDAFVPSCLQILGSVRAIVDKAEAYCTEKGCSPEELVGASLYEDMRPFAFQVQQLVSHSIGAIEGVRKGVFSPDMSPAPETFAAMRDMLDGAVAGLEAVTADEVNGFIGRDMKFSLPAYDMEIPFTAENFLLSFSQPNFYFHATTGYGILRHKGVAVGKQDFLGAMRIKTA